MSHHLPDVNAIERDGCMQLETTQYADTRTLVGIRTSLVPLCSFILFALATLTTTGYSHSPNFEQTYIVDYTPT
jgi:hypothetical protein